MRGWTATTRPDHAAFFELSLGPVISLLLPQLLMSYLCSRLSACFSPSLWYLLELNASCQAEVFKYLLQIGFECSFELPVDGY